jgi:Glycosyl transferases group 1
VTKALVLGITDPRKDRISAAQLYPFLGYRKQLRQRLGLEVKVVEAETLTAIHSAYLNHLDYEVFILRPSWREDPSQVLQLIKTVRENSRCQRLILIDPFDQTSSRFFNVLPHVDWLVKYQCLKDLSEYQQDFVGGTKLTDYLVQQLGYDLEGWSVGSKVPKAYEQRIVAGWNLGIDPRWRWRLSCSRWLSFLPQRRKDIDIFCRLSLGGLEQQEWYGKYRLAAIAALHPLEPEYHLAISGKFTEAGLVSRRQYNQELQRSRIVFSPFGWGELNWRDFEAACYGALLVKPSVEHIATEPNIFIPGETYVPVRWDFADLEEKCRYYLQRPEEMARIVRNAREIYAAYFAQEQVVQTLGCLLRGDRPPPSQNDVLVPKVNLYI